MRSQKYIHIYVHGYEYDGPLNHRRLVLIHWTDEERRREREREREEAKERRERMKRAEENLDIHSTGVQLW